MEEAIKLEQKQYAVLERLRRYGYSLELRSSTGMALDRVVGLYCGDTYLSEAIQEQADSCIPVCNTEVLAQAGELDEYVRTAITDGLVDTSPKEFSMVRLIQVAWYQFIEDALYREISTIAFNYMVDLLNDGDAEFNGDRDIAELESALEKVAEQATGDTTYYELEESAAIELALWLGETVPDMRNPVKTINTLKGNTEEN